MSRRKQKSLTPVIVAVSTLLMCVVIGAVVMMGSKQTKKKKKVAKKSKVDKKKKTKKKTVEREAPSAPMREKTRTAKQLPPFIDNSQTKYFPPIIRQKDNCCSQVSGICYMFTHEINLLRNLSSKLPENQYPSHFTYNYTNSGVNKGTWSHFGWDIAMKMGVPNMVTYGGRKPLKCDGWMTGYDKYYKSMRNKIFSHRYMKIDNKLAIEYLKGWLYNYNGKSPYGGGITYFHALTGEMKLTSIKSGPLKGKKVITQWGTKAPHAMTIVGYDDRVEFDLNGDGQITMNKDINGDKKIDVQDWERGAFILANSWGDKWADKGFCYFMYALCARKPRTHGGILDNHTGLIRVHEDYKPRVTLKLKINFSKRDDLIIKLKIKEQNEETYYKSYIPDIFNGSYKLGPHPMRGLNNNEPIEIGVDLTEFTTRMRGKTVTVEIYKEKRSPGQGKILEASIRDYNTKKPKELKLEFSSKSITEAPISATVDGPKKLTRKRK